MAKDPAVLFYTSDFLSGTSFFTDSEIGQYIKLLCQQHQLGTIPKNHMISVCGSLDSIVISKFVQDEQGNYYNQRMREEAEKRRNFCKSRSNNKSGRKKKTIIRKSHENHMLQHMLQHMENENENENENRNKNENNKFLPPKIEDVEIYCSIRKNDVDPHKWFDFYQAKNWMIGKNKMKDWKASVRTWENKQNENKSTVSEDYKRNILKRLQHPAGPDNLQ